MRQTWHDLLFAHWPIAANVLHELVPPVFQLDTYDGQAWIGVIPFQMSDVSLRWMPALPWISAFPELNVRTYVTVDDKPGVYFFSLDAGNRLAVAVARRFFFLPYFHARMISRHEGDTIYYSSKRIHPGAPYAAFQARYRPTGAVLNTNPGSLERWLTERYCLYTTSRGRAYRLEIQHAPWQLQPAEAEIEINTMTAPHSIRLPDTPPLLHFSQQLKMVGWPLEQLQR